MFNNLKREMKHLEIKNKDIANTLCISEKDLEAKLNGQKELYLQEAIKIRKIIIKKVSNLGYLFK